MKKIPKLQTAKTLRERLVGLLGRDSLLPDEGLWIHHCNSVHTFFMRFPIDVVFLDHENRIVRIARDLKPFRLTPLVLSARSVVELCAGSATLLGLKQGELFPMESNK